MGFSGEVSTPLTVRSFLDDFCEHKEIGRGSFGRVFSCRRKIDLALYAVKEINHEFRSERERERYVRCLCLRTCDLGAKANALAGLLRLLAVPRLWPLCLALYVAALPQVCSQLHDEFPNVWI